LLQEHHHLVVRFVDHPAHLVVEKLLRVG